MKSKKHIWQRWYEMTEKERINMMWFSFALVCLLVIFILAFSYIPFHLACSTGDIDLNINYKVNETDVQLTNLSINGVKEMRCNVDMPFYIMTGFKRLI